MKLLKNIFIKLFFTLAFFFMSCAEKPEIPDAEEKLLQVFQTERLALQKFENRPYVDYMDFQIKSFDTKQKLTVSLINQINKNHDALPDTKKENYQREWTTKFQPVIDDIYARTRSLIVNQTGDLSRETMAKIQVLSDRMNALEKKAPSPKLEPKFFATPVLSADGLKSKTP